ncbi:G1/S-specific cyclin Cln1p [Monosporozyma unispora]
MTSTSSSSTYSTISVNSANNNSNVNTNVNSNQNEISNITNNNRIRNCSTTMANLANQNNNYSNNTANNNTNNNNSTQHSMGLIVTAKQIYYPIELSNSELLSHYEMIQEYQYDIASNIIQNNSNCNPSLKLINQQPELNPHFTRPLIIEFLYKLSKLTRVTNGIFFQAMRLFDRYCSKRIVLRDQIHLILGTCLWLSAKTYGGCNHIINNVVVPTGGRFYGPNPRARIPRLNELVYFCQQATSSADNSIVLDESMFLQMEKHILDTLNWEVSEPTFNDYVLNVDENCLIQYELYQRQSHLPQDMELNDKIQLIHLKNFLMDLVAWKLDFLSFELFELTYVIFHLINRFTNESDQSSLLDLPIPQQNKQATIFNIFIESISNAPELLLNNYKDHSGIIQFINNVKLFYLQSKQSSLSKLSINTSSVTSTLSPQSIPSPVYSNHSSTPLRNISGNSENSIFSSIMESNGHGNNSPLTPSIYDKSMDWSSTNNSLLSLGKRSYQDRDCDGKENMIIPPRSKFLNTGISTNESNHSSRTSLISLTVGQ